MRRILPIEGIRLKHDTNAREVVIRGSRISKHFVQSLAAACFGRLLPHIGIDALPHILPRLLNRLITTDGSLRAFAQFVVLRLRPHREQLFISSVADERNKDRHHDNHADERDCIQLKADTPSLLLPLFLQNILSFPLRPAIPIQNEASLAITARTKTTALPSP